MDPEFKWNVVKVLSNIKYEEKESNILLVWIMKNGLDTVLFWKQSIQCFWGKENSLQWSFKILFSFPDAAYIAFWEIFSVGFESKMEGSEAIDVLYGILSKMKSI